MSNLLRSIAFFATVLLSTVSLANSHTGKVTQINMYGGEWPNSWRGGILYKLNSMPTGVTYFTIKQNDIAFQMFFAALLSAKHAQAVITVSYEPGLIDNNGYANSLIIRQE